MSVVKRIPWQYRMAGWLARKRLQPFWQAVYRVALRGLGYNNFISAINGEGRFALAWARAHAMERVVIFDVGANEGDFTAAIQPLLPHARFHLFEPNPRTFGRLQERYGAAANVTVEPRGIAAAAGALTLYDFRHGRGSERASFLVESFTEILQREAEPLPARVVSLDAYAAERGIDFIDLLKIDTEGFEKQVLAGAARLVRESRIGAIQVEMNEHNVVSGFSLYALTKQLPDFDIYRIVADGLMQMVSAARPYAAGLDLARYCNLVAVNRTPRKRDPCWPALLS